MAYHHDSRRIFVGQDNGAIMVSCCDFSAECRLELLRLPMCCWQLIVCFLSIHFGMRLLLNSWASWQFSWDICGRAAKQRFFWLDVIQVASRSPWAISAAVDPNNYTWPSSCFEGSTVSWAECHGGALTEVVNFCWFAPGQEYGSVCILPTYISGFACCRSFYNVEISTLALKFYEAEFISFLAGNSLFSLCIYCCDCCPYLGEHTLGRTETGFYSSRLGKGGESCDSQML